MKVNRLFALVLTLIIAFAFVGCKTSNTNKQNNSTTSKLSSKTSSKVNTQTSSKVENNTTSKPESEVSSSPSSETSSKTESVVSSTDNETEGTKLEDGSILYAEDKPSDEVKIEFLEEYGDVLLNTDDVAKISALFISGEGYAIQFDFTDEGKEKFKTATEQNLGKYIFLFINDELIISPMVNTVITDGKTLIINPEISKEELMDLYDSLT